MTYINALLSVVQLVAIIVSMIKHYRETKKSASLAQESQQEASAPTNKE